MYQPSPSNNTVTCFVFKKRRWSDEKLCFIQFVAIWTNMWMCIYSNFYKNASSFTSLILFLTPSEADEPRVWKALTSRRCLSICPTATAKLVSHTGVIAHTHTHTCAYTPTHALWIDLIQPLNAASSDSRSGSVLEKFVVWNRSPRGGLRSELWLTPPTSPGVQWTLGICQIESVWIHADNFTDQAKTWFKSWEEYFGNR